MLLHLGIHLSLIVGHSLGLTVLVGKVVEQIVLVDDILHVSLIGLSLLLLGTLLRGTRTLHIQLLHTSSLSLQSSEILGGYGWR